MIKKICPLLSIVLFSCQEKITESPLAGFDDGPKLVLAKFYTLDTTFKKQSGFFKIKDYIPMKLQYREYITSCADYKINSFPLKNGSYTVDVYKPDSSFYKTFKIDIKDGSSYNPGCEIFLLDTL